MKKAFNRWSLAALAMTIFLMAVGVMSLATGLLTIGCVQSMAFAVASPQGACFNAVLTPDQLREMGEVLIELKKIIPEYEKRFGEFEARLTDFRRAQLGSGRSYNRPRGCVSDDCARQLAAAVALHAAKSGRLEDFIRDPMQRDSILSEARSYSRTARSLSTSEIPLPVTYGTELIELIAEFGVARDEMMSFPMSGGQNRPPRWGTRPQFGAISMAAAVDEKKPTIEFCDLTSKKLGGIVIAPSEIEAQSLVLMGRFLAQYGAVEFARAEDTWAFLADGSATYEGVEGLCKIASDNDKEIVMASGKTKPSDATLENFRALRRMVNTAALAGGAYYINQTWEGALRSFNTVNEKVFEYRPDGTATLDGFRIRWTEVLQPYQDTAAADVPIAVFGRLKFWLMGQRGLPRVDTSRDAYFLNDMLATRFLEEIDFDYLSIEAAAVLKTAAS